MGGAYPEIVTRARARSRRRCAVRRSASPRRSTAACGESRSIASARRAGAASRRRALPVHALRHVRLPARPGRGGLRRTRGWRVTERHERGVRRRDGSPARARPGRRDVRRRGDGGRRAWRRVYQRLGAELPPHPSSSATSRSTSPGDDPGARARRRSAVAEARRGRRGRGHPRSHAGLRGVGRPDGRHGHRWSAGKGAARSPTRTTAAPS